MQDATPASPPAFAGLRDSVRLVDGPLEGRRLLMPFTPKWPIEVHAAVAPDGRVLAIEGERAPIERDFVGKEFRYEPVIAKDGEQSRADDGYLRYFFVREVAS